MSAPDQQLPSLSSSGTNIITDLVGDPFRAPLTLAMNGNQFMVLPDMVALWQQQRPDLSPLFYETLPPGLLVEQVMRGGISIGALTLHIMPDVIAAGPDMLADLVDGGLVSVPRDYASNQLAMLTAGDAGSAVHVLEDLAEESLRVAMPDPRTEGVGRLIVRALEAAGGSELVERVMGTKVRAGTTRLTTIHHRESPAWLLSGEVDVAPLWATEARWHVLHHAQLRELSIPVEHNQTGRYAVARVLASQRGDDADSFIDFLCGSEVAVIYRRFGFAGPVRA